MLVAKGVLTAKGGATSHAAVIARGMGITCITGCETLYIDETKGYMHIQQSPAIVHEGDMLSLDGSTGEIFLGSLKISTSPHTHTKAFNQILKWADNYRALEVWANADTPQEAEQARRFGAEGIGLCRTEHMFMDKCRLPLMQKFIMGLTTSDTTKSDRKNKEIVKTLQSIQQDDFIQIFHAMLDTDKKRVLPVVIRLLDPPLHEFLPAYDDLLIEITTLQINDPHNPILVEKTLLLETIRSLREANPMLGLRGCRLGLLFPSVIDMQVRAILTAAVHFLQQNIEIVPKILIPLVSHINELKHIRIQIEEIAKELCDIYKLNIPFSIGVMIEVPRAALIAGELARYADFFSFGTNDLTQTTFGISRDDAEGKFLQQYTKGVASLNGENNVQILPENPFQTLDQQGVGLLIQQSVEQARLINPEIEVGVCGEHGGDPQSIEFFHTIGLRYVSCSPYRIPVARLSSAHAALAHT
jgi:pyruvate,orthophosphate dikinase